MLFYVITLYICCFCHGSDSPVVQWVGCLSPARTGSVGRVGSFSFFSYCTVFRLYCWGWGGVPAVGGNRAGFSGFSGGLPEWGYLCT